MSEPAPKSTSDNIAPHLQHLAISLGTISIDPANTRTHPERNVQTIMASLRAFGQQRPIVIDSNNVVMAGNGTVEAARRLDWTHVAATQSDLQGAQRIAFAIADNRTAELAEWDDEALAPQLAALRDDETVDHLAAGFDDQEIDALLAEMTAPEFEPVDDDGQRLDQLTPVCCPECGYTFVPERR